VSTRNHGLGRHGHAALDRVAQGHVIKRGELGDQCMLHLHLVLLPRARVGIIHPRWVPIVVPAVDTVPRGQWALGSEGRGREGGWVGTG
jgi:hypothetical protein